MTDKTDTTALVIAEELNEWARDYAPTELATALATCAAVLLKKQNARIAELEALQAAPPAPAAVAVPDERDAYIHWLTSKHPDVYTTGDAMHWWGHGHVSALAWLARAALAAAPAHAVAAPQESRFKASERMGQEARKALLLDPCKNTPELDAAIAGYLKAAAPAQEHATQLAGQGHWKEQGYASEAEYAADMQAVGEALMEAIKDNYASLQAAGWDRPMDSPAEIVVDLLNLLDGAKAAAPAQAQEDARDTDALKASRDTGINHGVCLALQIMHAAGDAGGTQWDELLSVAGRDEMESYAKHVEPDEWELCGFGQVERREAEIQAIGAAQGGATP